MRTAQASFGGGSDAWRDQTPRSLETGNPWSAGRTGSTGGGELQPSLFGLQRANSLGSLQSGSLESGSSRGSSELYVYGAAQPMSDEERHTLYLEMVPLLPARGGCAQCFSSVKPPLRKRHGAQLYVEF